MLEAFRKRVAKWIAPKAAARMYQSARVNRLTAGFTNQDTSADTELWTGLRVLRARSRQLVRDAAYAKRAKVIVQNNVIGSGIGMQAQVMTDRGDLNERINDAIEEAFYEWSRPENCHTGGMLHFCDLERAIVGQVFEAGENFERKHYRVFGSSEIPFALELIEAERLPDETPNGPLDAKNGLIRMSVEVDDFYRPIAYWIRKRHPGEILLVGNDPMRDFERVPANQIMHLRIIERWPQTRGEPWLHTVIRKLGDMDAYSEAEIIASRGAASYMAIIETDDPDAPIGQDATDGTRQVGIEPGLWEHLGPGEKLNFVAPNRPNSAMDPFMRLMLREVAAGIGVSYESLSRDYSQSNYSSSRLALLDDRDLWRVLQQWYIRSFRMPLHREWLRQAVLSGAIPEIDPGQYMQAPEKFEAVRFKPRGWTWIDPSVDVDAALKGVRGGFTTTEDVLSQTSGEDLDELIERRARELEKLREAGLILDSDPDRNHKADDVQPAPAPAPAAEAPAAAPPADGDPPEDAGDSTDAGRHARLVSFRR